jgi:hypothetical protein
MSSYAKIINGVVVNIIIADKSFVDSQDDLYIKCEENGVLTKNILPIPDSKYDADLDVFIEPQPYPSWVLNDKYVWEPPVSEPEWKEGMTIDWDEESVSWNVLDYCDCKDN